MRSISIGAMRCVGEGRTADRRRLPSSSISDCIQPGGSWVDYRRYRPTRPRRGRPISSPCWLRLQGASVHAPVHPFVRRSRSIDAPDASARNAQAARLVWCSLPISPNSANLHRCAVQMHPCTVHWRSRTASHVITRSACIGASLLRFVCGTRGRRRHTSVHRIPAEPYRRASAGASMPPARVSQSEPSNAHRCAPNRRPAVEFRISRTRIVAPAFLVRTGGARGTSAFGIFSFSVSFQGGGALCPPYAVI
jgi:hypothetical protein